MIETQSAAESKAEARLMRTWTRAAEQVFERLTSVKPQLEFTRLAPAAGSSEQLASLEWWEAEYEAAGGHRIWIGLPAPAAVEISRLAQAVAAAGKQQPDAQPLPAREMVESLCEAFARILSTESGKAVQYRGLKRLETAPAPEVLYSTAVNLQPGSAATIWVGFKTATNATFQQLVGQPAAGPEPLSGPGGSGPLGLLLDLELPLSVRFGRAQMPLERVLELRTGSVVELEGTQDDQVELLVNGSVVARGEVVAVEGHYGVRILEILSRDGKIAASRPGQ